MSRFAWLAALLFAFAGAASAVAQDAKADPREKLETAIPEAIRLLEAKDYAKLLKDFVKPEDFKRITASTPLEDFARKFGEGKAPRLLEALKAAKELKPELADAGRKATYSFKEPIGGKSTITFVQVDKYWYIAD